MSWLDWYFPNLPMVRGRKDLWPHDRTKIFPMGKETGKPHRKYIRRRRKKVALGR